MGRIEAGEVKAGDTIVVLPANREATVAEIIAPVPGGTAQVDRAFAGQTVTIRRRKTWTCRAAIRSCCVQRHRNRRRSWKPTCAGSTTRLCRRNASTC